MDFIYQLGGVEKLDSDLEVEFHNPGGSDRLHAAVDARRRRRVRLEHTIFGDDFAFLRDSVTTAVPKLTIPSPSMVHYRGGRAAIDETVYPDLDAFWADLTAAYREEVRRLGELGCRYLQLDDTSLAYLNDPKQREHVAEIGGDPRAPARGLHPPPQRGDREPARGHGGSRRTCAAATSARRGSPRAATSTSPRCCSTSSRSTASSWSATTSARAASSRCASCRRASWSCSAS